MPRFFFSLRYRPGENGLAVDHEGDELADETQVRAHALHVARETIVKDRMATVRDWMVCSFEITDEAGRHVMTVPFSDTVPVQEDED
jgi:hypothetical protein